MSGRTRVVAAAAVLLLAGQVPATHVAEASLDPVTVVVLDSPQNEYFGLGRAHTFTGTEIRSSGSDSSVAIELDNGAVTHRIEMASSPLALGTYNDTTWTGDPRLWITLGSTGSSGTGHFEILEAPIVDAENHVLHFAADFVLDTGGNGTLLLYGQIRIDSAVPIKALKLDVPGSDDVDVGAGTVMSASAPTAITVSNVGNEAFSLDGLTIAGANPGSFAAGWDCPASLAPGASCSIALTYRPDTAGNLSAIVTFATDALHWGRWFRAIGTATFAAATNLTPQTAIVIGSLPFGHAGTDNEASSGSWNACPGYYTSLWYRYTTTTRKRIELDGTGSGGPVSVMVSAGSPDVQPFACGNNIPVTFTAEPNTTYWVRVQRQYSFLGGNGVVLQARQGQPDVTVDVSGVGVSATTFYPYVDAYRDTVAIRGTRTEKASVAISIYGPAGGKVRAFSVAAANGPWSVAWNGRSASGTALAAGKYRIVQTITDVWGNRVSATAYTTISWKRLYLSTWSRTLDAAAYAASGKVSTGSISRTGSSYSGGVRISTGTGGGAAGLGYAFTVPAATVYKSITFQVLGRGNFVAGGFQQTGLQQWSRCTTWDESCVGIWGSAPRTYGWAGVKGTGSAYTSTGRTVRGYVRVWTYGSGIATWLDARDVKLTVVYGILK